MNHLEGRFVNNFGFVKFVLSILVIFSHSFSLLGKVEPLYGVGSKYGIGSYAVFTFLLISGYSIAESWERNKNLFFFVAKRIKRIFPALLFLYIIKVFFLAPLFSTNNYFQFISNSTTLSYFLNIFFYYVPFQNVLPGVFDGKIVNGSLWTLPYEFALYISIPSLYFLFGKFWRKSAIVCFLALLALEISQKNLLQTLVFFQLNLASLTTFSLFFFSGILFRPTSKINHKFFTFLLFLLLDLLTFGKPVNIIFVLLFVWFFIDLFGFVKTKYFKNLNGLGNYSYGIYIWGWLVQQAVIEILGKEIPVIVLFIFSSILSVQIGIISWKFIESKFSKSFYS